MATTNSATKTNLELNKFVRAISEKKFAEANKYLKNAVLEKLKVKISEAAK
jgi:hypothetical protein